MKGRTLEGIWNVVDPTRFELAAAAALFVGLCAAAADGPMSWGWAALTVLGILAIDAAKNASGEVFDYDSGDDLYVSPEDRSPFSGGKRVLVDGLLSRGEVWTIAGVGYAIAAACGLAIVFFREPRVLWLGVIGMALAFFYHAPPFKLSYRGFGEIAVGLCYGPLIACGAYLVQRGAVPWPVVAVTVPTGISMAGCLFVQEFPDYNADKRAGKKTLVVRLGRARAVWVYTAMIAAGTLAFLALPLVGAPSGAMLGILGFLPAASAARRLHAEHEVVARMIDAQKRAILSFVLAAAGTGVGLLVL